MLEVSLSKQDGRRREHASEGENGAQGGNSPLEEICPLAETIYCQPSRGQLNEKYLNQVKPASWQPGKSVGGADTVDPKAESVYPEEHEIEDIYSVSFTEPHQLARVMHLNITGEQWVNAKRCDLNCAK